MSDQRSRGVAPVTGAAGILAQNCGGRALRPTALIYCFATCSASSGPTKLHEPGWRLGNVHVRPVGRWTLAHRPAMATSSRTCVTCVLLWSSGASSRLVCRGLPDALWFWLFTAATPRDLLCRKRWEGCLVLS